MIKDDSWRVIDPEKRVFMIDYLDNMTPLSTRSKESSNVDNDIFGTYSYEGIYGKSLRESGAVISSRSK